MGELPVSAQRRVRLTVGASGSPGKDLTYRARLCQHRISGSDAGRDHAVYGRFFRHSEGYHVWSLVPGFHESVFS